MTNILNIILGLGSKNQEPEHREYKHRAKDFDLPACFWVRTTGKGQIPAYVTTLDNPALVGGGSNYMSFDYLLEANSEWSSDCVTWTKLAVKK